MCCYSPFPPCHLCGNWHWEKNDNVRDFTLDIVQKDGFLIGRHCHALNSGNKIDCSASHSDISFKIKLPVVNSLTTQVRGFYQNGVGAISIRFYKDKIYRTLLNAPKGEYYLPHEAVLTVGKP